MSDNELNATQPNRITEMDDTQPNPVIGLNESQLDPGNVEPVPASSKKFPFWLALLVLFVLAIIGILGGYASGMGKRYSAESTLVTGQLQEQYQLGVQAATSGNYEVAKQHFEYILQHNPNFPGVREAYAGLLVHLLITPTLTPTSTPTLTPTPDARSADVIYPNVVALLSAPGKDLCARDWNDIISKLDSMRKADKNFHAVEVDGMYFIALRNRGVCKIYPQTYEPNSSCQDLKINLEGGIYDLTLAERFAPLDNDASSLRTWSRKYIIGASFWDEDWVQVKDIFSQVMANYPNLSDSNCTSAIERWRQASIGFAQQLITKGDYCGAEQQFNEAFSINTPKNEQFYPTATEVQSICNGDTAAPTAIPAH
jgi:hypothetical protein